MKLLHMDLFGLIAYLSIDESKYDLVIVVDYTRFTGYSFYRTGVKPKKP
jgi:hypothetical protein